MNMAETRKFTVSPHIIFSLIKAQAGSLGKAITECVMNSVDALATKVEIEVNSHTVRIIDNGAGFQSRDEIEAWFETLGFDHSDEGNHRAFGSFGIGRAQLWSFASTVWRTHSYTMDVDIKNKGLDYELNEFASKVPGLTIDGTFYAPLTDGQLTALEQELRRLIKYIEIPVYLNGKSLCIDPTKEAWDFETKDAWFRFDQSKKSQLSVYNMGVFVKDYWFSQYNIGGMLVTKPKVKLSLNMARNDVLVADCTTWPRIVPVLKEFSSVEQKKPVKEKASEGELKSRVAQLLAATAEHQLNNFDVFTDIRGRTTDLSGLRRSGPLFFFADPKNEKAKRAHALKLARGLSFDTLKRFGVKSAAELKAVLMAIPALAKDSWYSKCIGDLQFFDTLEEALPNMNDQYDVLPEKDLAPVEVVLLAALSKTASYLGRFAIAGKPYSPHGSVRAGKSDQAKSWCFAGDTILDARTLKKGVDSFHGFAQLATCVLHEILAELKDSNFAHVHTPEYYEAFHAAMHDEKVYLQFRYGYQFFVRECTRKSIDLPRQTLEDMDAVL